jgi:hypothetical protein
LITTAHNEMMSIWTSPKTDIKQRLQCRNKLQDWAFSVLAASHLRFVMPA